jgi:hypothetical protein
VSTKDRNYNLELFKVVLLFKKFMVSFEKRKKKDYIGT